MKEKNDLLNVVGTIYSAPGNAEGWNEAVRKINDHVHGKASAYMLVNGQTMLNEVNAFCGFSREHLERYEGYLGREADIRFRYLHNLIPGKAFREFEFVDDKEAYDKSEWIRYQLETLGAYWCLASRVSTHGLWQDIFAINKLKELGPFTVQEKSDFELLIPHIAQAAELHRTISSLEKQYNAVLSVLDYLLVGLIILDKKKRIVVANITAKEICENSGVASLNKKGYFSAYNHAENVIINNLIDQAISTSTESEMHHSGQIKLTRNDISVLAEIMPLKDDGMPDGDNIQGAAIFLIDINISHVVTLDGISQIFSLTKTEHRIASLITNGFSVKDVADARSSTTDTVRKHLKSIYAKTGANSQLELLRLAAKATPPIK